MILRNVVYFVSRFRRGIRLLIVLKGLHNKVSVTSVTAIGKNGKHSHCLREQEQPGNVELFDMVTIEVLWFSLSTTLQEWYEDIGEKAEGVI